jgi:arginine decarboxylase
MPASLPSISSEFPVFSHLIVSSYQKAGDSISSNRAAAVGVAMPRDPTLYGYLSEHHSHGQTERAAGDYSEDLAAEMLATTLGVAFDPDQDWDAKRELWRISGRIVRTTNMTQSAIGNKHGLWTTVVAAAVLIVD